MGNMSPQFGGYNPKTDIIKPLTQTLKTANGKADLKSSSQQLSRCSSLTFTLYSEDSHAHAAGKRNPQQTLKTDLNKDYKRTSIYSNK